MSNQIVCDSCHESIDQSISYFSAQVQNVQMIDGVLTGGPVEQRDYHSDHLPGAMAMEGGGDGG